MKRYLILLGLLILGLGLGIHVLAATPINYDLNWHVIGGGGRPAASDTYTLHHTAGQPIIGAAQSEDYALGSGYWPGIAGAVPAPPNNRVYLPMVISP